MDFDFSVTELERVEAVLREAAHREVTASTNSERYFYKNMYDSLNLAMGLVDQFRDSLDEYQDAFEEERRTLETQIETLYTKLNQINVLSKDPEDD